MTYPNGSMKAVTFSYDDASEHDPKLVEIFNRYGMKATFNANSALAMRAKEGTIDWFLPIDRFPELYRGHEVAMHGATHPDFTKLTREEIHREIAEDRACLEQVMGTPVRGMAYPSGACNDLVVAELKACGALYARTVDSSHSFALPEDFYHWNPTCHHDDEQLEALMERFLALDAQTPCVFYIWGHSHEFDRNHNWERIEHICRTFAGHEEIYKATNIQVYQVAENTMR